MSPQLGGILAEMGLSQYLHGFREQGFRSWATVLDIRESDLDELGVKLGHRRKLQRRISNDRRIPLSVPIPSIYPLSVESKTDSSCGQPSSALGTRECRGVAKRRYRRHPKPDTNAPDRPASAYVAFTNKMRESLKTRDFTFSSIAKMIGKSWRTLDPTEKERYVSQADAAKKAYSQSLAEYRDTDEYRNYSQYLLGFKAKQASESRCHNTSRQGHMGTAKIHQSSNLASLGEVMPTGSRRSFSQTKTESASLLSRRDQPNPTVPVLESGHSPAAPSTLVHNAPEDPDPPRQLFRLAWCEDRMTRANWLPVAASLRDCSVYGMSESNGRSTLAHVVSRVANTTAHRTSIGSLGHRLQVGHATTEFEQSSLIAQVSNDRECGLAGIDALLRAGEIVEHCSH